MTAPRAAEVPQGPRRRLKLQVLLDIPGVQRPAARLPEVFRLLQEMRVHGRVPQRLVHR